MKDSIKSFKLGLLFIIFMLGIFSFPEESIALHSVKIGILKDGPYWHNAPLLNQIKKELKKINEGQFDIQYPAEFTLDGQYDFKQIEQQAKKLAHREDLDVILAVGMVSSYVFSNLDPLEVPVVALDYILPASFGMLSPETYKPFNPNWTTTFDPAYVDQTLDIFPKLIQASHFVIFCPNTVCGYDPKIVESIESFVDHPGITVKVELVTPENYKAKVQELDSPFVVVEALKGFSDPQMEDLYKRLRDRNILTFTVD